MKRETKLQQYHQTLTRMGPIPPKQGAGTLTVKTIYGSGHSCRCESETEFSNEVARSYKYPVTNNWVTWVIPRNHTISIINGLVTSLYQGDQIRSNLLPVKCHWPVKGRGYSADWQAGWLYRGYHKKSKRGLVAGVTRTRRKALHEKIAARIKKEEIAKHAISVWVTPEKLRSLGACSAGISAAKNRIQTKLQATGEIGAVRASYLLELGGEYAYYARRAIVSDFVQA
jgi:hypothetical protein